MPGSGKSHWMKRLAKALDYKAVDMDVYIEQQSKKSIPELFALSEAYFREQERAALEALIAGHNDQMIIATGGGAPVYRDNMDLMKKNGLVIYLEVAPEQLVNNVARSRHKRPLLATEDPVALSEKIKTLYRSRQNIYERADLKISADSISLATFAATIMDYQSKTNTGI